MRCPASCMRRQDDTLTGTREQIQIRKLRVLREESIHNDLYIRKIRSQRGFSHLRARPVAHLEALRPCFSKATLRLLNDAQQSVFVGQWNEDVTSRFQNAPGLLQGARNLSALHMLQNAVREDHVRARAEKRQRVYLSTYEPAFRPDSRRNPIRRLHCI